MPGRNTNTPTKTSWEWRSASSFPPALAAVTDELNSPEFVAWISELTGIPNLMSDPMLEGGGLHQSGPGGYLNVHTDFSMHHFHTNWRRRVNLILYLNPGWREEWGGALELWEQNMTRCAAKYSPLLNHALIFTTDERSLHGFPDPLTCPKGVSRKSLALYYYTLESDKKLTGHSTDYFARPQDGWRKSAMIWLDKKAVDLLFAGESAVRILRRVRQQSPGIFVEEKVNLKFAARFKRMRHRFR